MVKTQTMERTDTTEKGGVPSLFYLIDSIYIWSLYNFSHTILILKWYYIRTTIYPTMKNLHTLILALIFLLIISCTHTKESNNDKTTAEAFTAVEVEVYKSLIAEGGMLLDVRTPVEFAAGKIDGASNIDWMAGDFAHKVQALDKETPVYVYCTAGGKRSIDAMQKMKDLGFKEVYNLKGGYVAWMEKK